MVCSYFNFFSPNSLKNFKNVAFHALGACVRPYKEKCSMLRPTIMVSCTEVFYCSDFSTLDKITLDVFANDFDTMADRDLNF